MSACGYWYGIKQADERQPGANWRHSIPAKNGCALAPGISQRSINKRHAFWVMSGSELAQPSQTPHKKPLASVSDSAIIPFEATKRWSSGTLMPLIESVGN